MKSLKGHLEARFRHDRFRTLFREEKQLARLSMQILEIRKRLGLSRQEVADRAQVTRHQLSNLERGADCNVSTFLKVCNALGVIVELETPEFVEEHPV